jgi:lysyl-tRNA synthetase, class II
MTVDINNERSVRLDKLARIRALGVHPYPESYEKSHTVADAVASLDTAALRHLDDIQTDPRRTHSLAGRLVLKRSFGKLVFASLRDETATVQVLWSSAHCRIRRGEEYVDELVNTAGEPMSAAKFADKLLDLGDLVGVSGEFFLTQKGELTLYVADYSFLGKALRPLPEKFHGIADEETKYRKRYLDLVTDPDAMARMKFRSRFIAGLREFYAMHGFTEIEGQTLTNTPTGAAAKPYVTHQNALGTDVYLRISHEIPLKLLNIAGMERVFELGKAFRNEGMDPSHLPEHTHLEHNVMYWTYRDNMRFTEEMFDFLFEKLGLEKKRKILNKNNELVDVDFTTPWRREDYVELVKRDSGIDVSKYSDVETLRADIRARGLDLPGMETMGLTTLIDYLYKKVSRPKIVNPTFLYNYPVVLKPFARRNDENPDVADAFQLLVNGWELVNSYSELVDPIDQLARFRAGDAALEAGDEEAMRGDMEFVEAMEHGMTPISGWGMGVDRILALLTEQNNLRDVVLFPLLRPETKPLSSKEEEARYRAKKIAVVADPAYPAGVAANATAHASIMLAEHAEKAFVGEVKILRDADGAQHLANSIYPVANLAAPQDAIRSLVHAAREE